MNSTRADVAIIGGGPAGLSAAAALASAGVTVALLEAKRYPHDKMCGEFLSPECRGFLSQIGLGEDDLAGLGAVAIHTARITAPDGSAWEEHLPGTALGISRRVLDAALAERARQAGAEVCEGVTVTGVQGSLEQGFTVETRTGEFRARLVIAAHGKRSGMDRALNRDFLRQKHPFLAIKAHFHGPPVPGRVELHGFPGGYCGISEIEGDARVVCLLVREPVFRQAADGAEPTEAFIGWMAAQNPRLGEWLRHAERLHPRWIAISQVAFCPKPALEQDILMAGDAAGLIVPLAGNGISMALDGGLLAARWSQAFLSGEASANDLRRGYPAGWSERFRRRLALGRALQPLMLRPGMLSPAMRLIAVLPPLGRYLMKATRS